jgi:hypothetical protein
MRWARCATRSRMASPIVGSPNMGDATPLDGRVAQVRVVDPHHPLHGGCYPVSERPSGRGAALIVIRLPDGRERSIPRSNVANPFLAEWSRSIAM